MGEHAGYTSCCPNNFVGEQLLPLLPRFSRLYMVMKLTNVTVAKLNITSAIFPEYIPGNTKTCYIAYAAKVFQLLGSSPPFSDHTGPREYSDPGHRSEIPMISPNVRCSPKPRVSIESAVQSACLQSISCTIL